MDTSGTAINHSPRHSSDNLSSPQPRRAGRSIVSSPWNQIVRGESEPIAAAPDLSPSSPTSANAIESAPVTLASLPVEDSSSVGESFENGSGSNGNTGKRPAWNKPSNGAASEVKPVMGAVSWPALSESTRATMKSSESSKGLTDGSSEPQFQGTGSTSPTSQRQVGDNSINTTPVPTRQKSMKRSGSSASSNGGHTQQSASQASIAVTGSHNSSPKGHMQRSVFVSQSLPHNVNDHPQQPNSFRNRNGGAHQRGDGAHHHNYNRREQDRGNQDWITHRNFNGRDSHMHARVVPRYIRPPPPPHSAQFVPPPPMRPYGGPIGFPELVPPVVYVATPPPESMRTVPFVPPIPPHAVYFPAPDPQLHTKIVNQIDYYFSNENLIKDTYLRQNMDDQGWVPIKLIAGFNKVMHLTDNVQLILDALRVSSVVEVQGDKIRRRNDWRRWVMPSSVQFPNVTTPEALGKLGHERLTEQFQSIVLEKKTENDGGGGLDAQPEALQNRPTFGDLNSSLQLSDIEGTGQVSIQGSDHSISARN
ncbi:hypothetical protein L6164_020197 [Bauhinia variegata]|uniref:Uncharacterized protein n=1 Tax=Bauhinia variegata TaxID=167791 RepID=A0ACB9MUN5_BAUVA|nr:hypothetical protein L6164_020197 [Bauhinia variegata]